MAECLSSRHLDDLIQVLRGNGYRVIGPTKGELAIVYDDLRSAADLPIGWTDEQGPGHYRLKRRSDEAAFGYNVGPQSWKSFLFPPREELVQIRKKDDGAEWQRTEADGAPMAFLGVRACELAAMGIHDQVFTDGPYVDKRYGTRRERSFVVAVDCTEAGELCFCASMKTGPRAEGEFDLRLTEMGEQFLVEAGTSAGRAVLDALPTTSAEASLEAEAEEAISNCADSMGRSLDTHELPERLMGNLEHPAWEKLGERCLGCGNCTLSCPTCFCFNIDDSSNLSGSEASRVRSWDSCFTADHSKIHGAQFRSEVTERYRQWATHKLGTWTSQFGTSGCVGCGRCIAWCPVGIDITEEATTIASGKGAALKLPEPRSYERHDHDGQLPEPIRVLEVQRETDDTVTLVLDPPEGFTHGHGQFNMLSLPGIGDVPISISGSSEGRLEHTIRSVGKATAALCDLKAGDILGLRGPYGSSWPLEEAKKRPVVIVAGGIGLAPIRSAIREMAQHPDDYPTVRVIYGTRSPASIIFDRELLGWIESSHLRAHVTVDRGDATWTGNIGVVTKLLRRKYIPDDAMFWLCGPEIMMKFALEDILAMDVPEERVYMSMERNMKCAVGLCGRCQYGPHFICKDGPVFRYDEIASIFAKPGF